MKIYGVIHLKGLPGSTSNVLSIPEITTLAQNDINGLTEGGVDGIIIENFGDAPFVKDNLSKRSLVSFTTVASNLELNKNLDIGINVLRNDGISALAIAEAIDANFVRINVLNNIMYTDQGIIEGKSYDVSQFRNTLSKDIQVFADVFVKHATPPQGAKIENHTKELLERAGADVIIVSGDGTGEVTNIEDLNRIRNIVPKGKLAIGSGLNGKNIQDFSKIADIGIIGTDFKVDGVLNNPVDTDRVKDIIGKTT
ncbi:BtpA/SgcQ family protein [Acidimicrobiia bacterium]|nr:BtpA/SgcQ family protein [Acidimicrobiia bacterium]